MKNLKISCPCLFGLESTLGFEARKQEFKNVKVENGRVSFTGDLKDVARANINLATAERVQIVLKEFTATSFDELFDQTKSINFEDFIDEKEAFPVTGYTIDSLLFSMSDCQSIIKKAAVSRLNEHYGIKWFDESEAKIPIHFAIRNNHVMIMLDTTGVGLHKRGYRPQSVIAPIKETLAAGIIDIARPGDDSVFFDPMCGSGTFAIEAARKVYNIAPGINREFLFEHWKLFDENILLSEKDRASSLVKSNINFTVYASDLDKNAVELTKQNFENVGIKKNINIKQADIKDFSYSGTGGIVVTNPPYGERLLSKSASEDLYKKLGKVFTSNLKQYVITSHQHFESLFGKKADRRRKLYNGMIPCQLFMYFKKAK